MTDAFATREDMLAALVPLVKKGGAHDVIKAESEAIVSNIIDIAKIFPITEEKQNRLVGHTGLRGELWNGAGMIFHNYLKNVFNRQSAPETLIVMGIEEYSRAFLSKPSQLAKVTQLDAQRETSGEALERCYHEISHWVESDVLENVDMLDDFDRLIVLDCAKKIKNSLSNFNDARLSLKTFAEKSGAYLNLENRPYQDMDRQKYSQFMQAKFA
ncbi:MAG: hypothetical protein DI626_00075 [Micavibrio aeruginosavorus]|uniref:Uncharacterized protein n=1 Tax=Micavibrio aeruginosavorus TaxID=349221 RepID=A0A2W5A6S5_9BACT|nr:MAG: hypothetical protein DI626_00075 [Micavibrio aeruginosavorus]